MATFNVSVTDALGLSAPLVSVLGVQVASTLGLTHAAIGKQYQAGGLALAGLGLRDSTAVKATYGVSVVQVLGLVDSLSHQLPVAIVETLGFTGLLSVARAITVLEKLGLVDNLIGNDVTQRVMVEKLAFSDAILDFFGLGGIDSLGFSGVFTPTFLFNKVLSDTIGLTASVSENALFMRVVTDNAGFEDVDIPSMLYNQILIDAVDFTIGYIDPGTGEFTTWAVNTRTNATTEYQNYVFNSFCQIGNNYYGANADGLWLLNAQTDDGANIVTDIKGAMLALGGSRYTQLDGVYIGMRVDDNARDFILKLITPAQGIGGADKTFLYKFNPNNMRTTKINIGKGLRSRYIQWELITPGPDFDLDSIEFVPVISRRRTN